MGQGDPDAQSQSGLDRVQSRRSSIFSVLESGKADVRSRPIRKLLLDPSFTGTDIPQCRNLPAAKCVCCGAGTAPDFRTNKVQPKDLPACRWQAERAGDRRPLAAPVIFGGAYL
jgi:hypothetical protein